MTRYGTIPLQHHSLTNLWYKDGVFISGDYYVIVTQSGMYKLIQSNNCGSDTDSVYVNEFTSHTTFHNGFTG